MNDRDDIPTVRVEVISPANDAPRSKTPRRTAAEAEKLLKELVQRQIAEILAQREDFQFQPFFAAAKVANEIKRLQTVPEQRAWSVVFANHGCIICKRTNAMHAGCGCCTDCYGRVGRWKRAAIRGIEKSDEKCSPARDERELVLQAFASPMKALPAAKTPKQAQQEKAKLERTAAKSEKRERYAEFRRQAMILHEQGLTWREIARRLDPDFDKNPEAAIGRMQMMASRARRKIKTREGSPMRTTLVSASIPH